MKKLTSIVNLYHTSNFMEVGNNTGKVIDFVNEHVFSLVPVPELAVRIAVLQGHIISGNNFIQLLLPFDFSTNPPATSIEFLPDELFFFICIANQEKARFCALNFNKRILWVSPVAGTTDYIFDKRTIACKHLGANPVLADNDLVNYISANATLDEIHILVGQPLGDNDHLLDLKVTVNTAVITVTKDEDLKILQAALREVVYTTIPVSFNKNSDNSLLRNFAQILVTPDSLSADVIGLVRIPVAGLTVNDMSPGNYADLNSFILHFPAFQSKIALTVNTTVFDGSSKLFLDAQEIVAPGIANHPQMPGYKQVTGGLNSYDIYANKSRQVIIQNGTKKISTTVNPMNNYNPATNTATIIITK